MKPCKALVVLRHPRELVWAAMRDRMPELVPLMDDIEALAVESRTVEADGVVRLVNRWQAKPSVVPPALQSVVRPEMVGWTDRAAYLPSIFTCRWQIEPHFHAERISCAGVTRYESIMNGRGTRITLEGTLEMSGASLPGVSSLVESFVATLVPKNFRRLTQAVDALLTGV